MGQKTLDQKVTRAQFCLKKALEQERILDAKQQQKRLRRLLKQQAEARGAA